MITTVFPSGRLAGRLRSVEQMKNGKKKIIQQLSYNADGRVIRQVINVISPKTYTYSYNEYGQQKEIALNGKLIVSKEYDARGRLSAKIFANGMKDLYKYEKDKVIITVVDTNGSTTQRTLDGAFNRILPPEQKPDAQ